MEGYCRERGNSVNAERFIDFYEMKGWMVGKNRMKNWKAAVRTWEKEDAGGKAAAPPQNRKAEENRVLMERMRMAGVDV